MMWSRLSDSGMMTPWEVIEQALAHKKPPRSPQWLADQLALKIQVVSNWKKRGVPPARYREVANAIGLKVDQLEGVEPLPWQKSFEWPFSAELQERLDSLTSEQLTAVEGAMWERIGEKPPPVIQEQLRKQAGTSTALQRFNGMQPTADESPASDEKTKQK